MGPGAAAQDMVLRELEPSEPLYRPRTNLIDYKAAQGVDRAAPASEPVAAHPAN